MTKKLKFIITVASLALMLVLAGFAFQNQAQACGGGGCGPDLGITPYEECDGYGITVAPSTWEKAWNERYVPVETQVNGGGGWNPTPYTDGPHAWNPSGQHNYEVKVRFDKQKYEWSWRDGWLWVSKGTATYGPVHLRLEKPDDCEPDHIWTVKFGQTPTCDGWTRAVNLYDKGVYQEHLYFDVGSWTDAMHYEVLPGMTFDVPDEYGPIPDVVFADLAEPRECHDFNIKSAQNQTCEKATRAVNLYDGSTYLGHLLFVQFPWVDPLGYEVFPGESFTVPAEYGGAVVDFPDLAESKDCHAFSTKGHQAAGCEAATRAVNLYVGGVYTQHLLFEQVFWTDPFVLETGLAATTFAVPGDYQPPASYSFPALNEPAECQVPHETVEWYEKDCDGWAVGYYLDGEKFTTKTGTWGNPYGPEHVAEVVVVPIPEGELGADIFWVDFDKDIDCIRCEQRVDHYLAEVHPTTEPTIPLMTNPQGQPFCAVAVPGEGVEPDLGRVAMACSKCLDQVEGGYIFVGEPGALGEAVIWNRCWSSESGYTVHYTWQGRYWKPGPGDIEKFTPTGRNPACPRIEGCSEWIREQVPELFPAPTE